MDKEVGDLQLYPLHYGLQSEGEEERSKEVSLVETCQAVDDSFPKDELSIHPITGKHPLENLGEGLLNYFECTVTITTIKSIN